MVSQSLHWLALAILICVSVCVCVCVCVDIKMDFLDISCIEGVGPRLD